MFVAGFSFCISGFKIALLQMFVEFNREKNLVKAAKMIKEAARTGAKVLVLPVSRDKVDSEWGDKADEL